MRSFSFPKQVEFFVDQNDWEILRKEFLEEQAGGALHSIVRMADGILQLPHVRLEKDPEGMQRLLMPARKLLSRVITLGIAWKVAKNEDCLARIFSEVQAAADLEDWHPSHFLDVAEMATAVAIARVWLREQISPATAESWENALLELALKTSLSDDPRNNWLRANNNWIQVCHGGLAAAALALCHREPELAQSILDRAIDGQQQVVHQYAPDGAYIEGPSYWSYGTNYSLILIDLLQRNFGHSFELDQLSGFVESAEYVRQMTAPTGKFWAYADGGEERIPQAGLIWFARQAGQRQRLLEELAFLEKSLSTVDSDLSSGMWLTPLGLFWGKKEGAPSAEEDVVPAAPKAWLGRGENPVAVVRSAWKDPKATFFGIKGGGAVLNHGHMDAGSFVFESHGVRWAEDPGMQPYQPIENAGINLWSKAEDSERWSIFRIGSDAHNILRFNGARQRVGPLATDLTMADREEGGVRFRVDLTPVYEGQAAKVIRTAQLADNGVLEITDHWEALATEPPPTVQWQWLTKAEVRLENDLAVLEKAGVALRLHFQSSEEFSLRLEIPDDGLRPEEEPNPGLVRIVLETKKNSECRSGWIRVEANAIP